MKSSKVSSKPKQYIQGWVEFYKLKFRVTADVLIPRPESELLVDEVINYYTLYPKPYTLFDIGTGSGNIAISIAKNVSNVKIIATDISPKALKVAQQNAKLHGVEDKITFLHSDLLHTIQSRLPLHVPFGYMDRNDESVDIIVTNLPYIPSARIPYLDSSVTDFEPKIALDGGPDGFYLYRKLFAQIKEKERKPKLIVGEIDYTHGELAVNEALKYFPKAQVEVKLDLARKQRILIIEP